MTAGYESVRDEPAGCMRNGNVFGGKGGRGQQVLIEIDGDVEDVLSAEPAIRCLKSSAGSGVDITVCSRHEGLFRNHPSVSRILNSRGRVGRKDYDLHYRVSGESPDGFAKQLGVAVDDECPRVYLDSFDLVGMQKFRLSGSDQPRIVIGAGAGDYAKLWDDEKWLELCDLLAGKLNANIVQVGQGGERFFGYGSNLIGKLTAREAATVVKSSDLLISVDNGYGCLSDAVGGYGVIMSDAADRVKGGTNLVVTGGLGSTMVKDIAIETVLDGMAELSRKAHRREMKRLSCA